jgi:futalosine hydrolase
VILLASAVDAELAFWRPREAVTTLTTGVGPVEAASAIAAALARADYRLLINAGLAGSLDGAATIGDGVVVSDDSIELGLETGDAIALPRGERVVERVRSDPAIVERLRKRGFAAVRGITVARVTSTETTARRLCALGAQVESMEGFAALRAAERAGVPAIQLRGISNRCGPRETSGWSFSAGIAGLRRILDAFFERQ